MDWTDEAIARLRALWDEGHSTAEIGRRLGITKNAVVGKAHRLSLPPRPSPIKRTENAERPVRRAAAPRRVVSPPLTILEAVVPVRRPVEAPRPAPVLRAVTASPKPSGRTSTCCWPIGEPGTPSFHFCSSGAMPGKPYCTQHAALAYVKVRDRREDAA